MQQNDLSNGRWGAIFDVDGTMVDNMIFHENAWIELGKRCSLPITREFYRENIHSRSNDRIVRTLFGDDANAETIHRISGEKETIYRDSFRPVIREIPGLRRLLEALKQAKVPCAAASNSPKDNVDMVLDELDIRDFFDVVIDRDMVAVGKPNPEILLKAAKALNLTASRCVVFEDSVSGFKAADNAEMPYIAMTAGADKDELAHAATAREMHEDFTAITPAAVASLIGAG